MWGGTLTLQTSRAPKMNMGPWRWEDHKTTPNIWFLRASWKRKDYFKSLSESGSETEKLYHCIRIFKLFSRQVELSTLGILQITKYTRDNTILIARGKHLTLWCVLPNGVEKKRILLLNVFEKSRSCMISLGHLSKGSASDGVGDPETLSN